jgi:hypothetical protein
VSKRVFISSVTEGLRQERTALHGLIRALGMNPIWFEDFTAAPEPSREVCLRAVGNSDVYLLLLGEHYGSPFPDTGLSPTHEEYRASVNTGVPRLAFRRRGVTLDPAQRKFVEEVEAYQTGLFRGSWEEVGELLEEAAKALSNLESVTGSLVFTPLANPVEVGWRTPPDAGDQFSGFLQSAVEVYLTPIGVTVGVSRLRVAGDLVARMLREFGGVGQTAAIDVTTGPDGGVVARVNRPSVARFSNEDIAGGQVEGLSVAGNGEVCAWATLRRDHFGAVLDEQSLAEVAVPLVVLAGRTLGDVLGDSSAVVVPSVAVTGARSVNLGRPEVVGNRSSSTMAISGPSVIVLPGAESALLSAVVTGASDVAAELGAQVEHALRIR